jgi:hypothetical protein
MSLELWLMNTALAFPKLGRQVDAASAERCCLEIFACGVEGHTYARWHDRPEEPLRPIDAERLLWI